MNKEQNVRMSFRAFHFVLAGLLFASAFISLSAEETNVAAPATKTEGAANALDPFRSYLHLQEQLHATQLALERNRQESETLAARNAEAIAARLQLIEQALSSQRARDQEAMQSANRLVLIVAGSFAVVGFIAMLLTVYFQWRAVTRLADFISVLPVAGRAALPAPGQTETPLVSAGATEQSNARLFGALTRLENRIFELEHTTRTQLAEKAISHVGVAAASTLTPAPPSSTDPNVTNQNDHLALLFAKGQSLRNLDKASEALACYDEILARVPNHPEALVKKGGVLEQLGQIDEALRCYDSAIAADSSMTVAYLQKGGLFNRLERYEEALQCYEEALRSQERARLS